MRGVLRTALLLLLAAGGAACRPDVPILTWHSIGGAGDELTVSEAAFAAQLDALRNAGFHTVTFHEWLEHEDRGASLPEKPILLTFDDGYQDALTAALPALRARGMRGTFFLVSRWIGLDESHRFSQGGPGSPRRYLVWPEVRALAAAGMEIGSHGATHARLPDLTEQQALGELTGSRRELETGLGAPVEVFAYPYNASRRRLRALVRKAGYRAAVSGSAHGGADRYELHRTGVQRSTSPEQLLGALR
ncbi:MAG TPA: polysaccharide deacetylase family protein [Myxococcales bacterium]